MKVLFLDELEEFHKKAERKLKSINYYMMRVILQIH